VESSNGEEPWPTAAKESSQMPQKASKPYLHRHRAEPSAIHTAQKARAKTNEWEVDCEICDKRGLNLVRFMSDK